VDKGPQQLDARGRVGVRVAQERAQRLPNRIGRDARKGIGWIGRLVRRDAKPIAGLAQFNRLVPKRPQPLATHVLGHRARFKGCQVPVNAFVYLPQPRLSVA
jgi:hypothetical protein